MNTTQDPALLEQAPDTKTLKQARWFERKIQAQLDRQQSRVVRTTTPGVRKRVPCTCVHTPKHHTKTGRCRPGCGCGAGMR